MSVMRELQKASVATKTGRESVLKNIDTLRCKIMPMMIEINVFKSCSHDAN